MSTMSILQLTIIVFSYSLRRVTKLKETFIFRQVTKIKIRLLLKDKQNLFSKSKTSCVLNSLTEHRMAKPRI